MILELTSTSTTAINRSLVELRASGGTTTLGRVLTLVAITTPETAEEAIAAATDASREHPMRVLVVVAGDPDGETGLDAEIRTGGDSGASETVVLALRGDLFDQSAAVVVPLLLPDAPIVAWWPGQAPADISADPIGRLAHRRITDAANTRDPLGSLRTRALHQTDGDTDMAWTRITRWRALLAAALDLPPVEPVTSAVVRGAADSPSSDLLAAWLHARLTCPVVREVAGDAGLHSVELVRRSGTIVLSRPEGTQALLSQPGEPDHRLALPRRSVAACLAEELRRLDPDVTYSEVLRSFIEDGAQRTWSESTRSRWSDVGCATGPRHGSVETMIAEVERPRPLN